MGAKEIQAIVKLVVTQNTEKNMLLERLEEAGLVDINLSGTAKHSRLKGLLNPISIAGGLDNPLVQVEYKRRQSNVLLSTQGESTLQIFG